MSVDDQRALVTMYGVIFIAFAVLLAYLFFFKSQSHLFFSILAPQLGHVDGKPVVVSL